MPTGISYLDETWNIILGCTHAGGGGCLLCWAEGVSHAHALHPNEKIASDYEGITKDGKWTGMIKYMEDRLEIPLRWKKPRRIGVSFMGDLFHPKVPFEFIEKVMAIIALTPQHIYLLPTKRAKRMYEYFTSTAKRRDITLLMNYPDWVTLPQGRSFPRTLDWPLPNLQLGVSIENQPTAERALWLARTPAAKRWISYEPAIGGADFTKVSYVTGPETLVPGIEYEVNVLKHIHWLVCGGESGPNARPMNPEWVRSALRQCEENGVIFHYKQAGEYGTISTNITTGEPVYRQYESYQQWVNKPQWINGGICLDMSGKILENGGDFMDAEYPVAILHRVGKKAAGHLLDGKEYREII